MKKGIKIKKILKVSIATIILAIVLLFLSTNFIIDLQWFSEVNYLNIYLIKLKAIAILSIPIFIVSFFILYMYFKSLKRNILEIIGNEHLKLYNKLTLGGNFLISLILAIVISATNWLEILKFLNSKSFNQADPIFNMDISFYMFKLPILKSIYNSIFIILFIVIVATIAIYFLLSLKVPMRKRDTVISIRSRGEGIKNFAGKQLAITSAAILFLIAIGYIFNSYNLVYSHRGAVYGASYTDVKVTLLFYRVVTITSIIAAIIVGISIWKKKYKSIIYSVGVVVILIGLQPLVSLIVQQFIVKSNEMEFELPYLSYNIEATKRAYNIDKIEEKSFEPSKEIKVDKLDGNKDIISNLRVNSAEPVLNFYKQVQLIKKYYTFKDVDTDRYKINGEESQVFIAPREINTSEMPVWQNKHLRYTHGYGVTMSKVNEVTTEGQPSFIMKDIPTDNNTDINLDNPRIYFGENTKDYAIVNTTVEEFDYPTGESENNFSYDGKAGIKLNPLNRVLFSIYEQNPKILISSAISSNSRILMNREIMSRVKKIAPFLEYDEDPYPVINDGKLLWIIDGYTTSDRYPFSEPQDDINYIRNSVKVTVDAYNGDVNFYIIDEKDPIIKNYSSIFKGLFKNISELPKGVEEHFRYPQGIFKLQSKVLAKYHTNDPIKLFTQEDLWDVSSDILNPHKDSKEAKEEIPVEVLYLMSKAHGGENLEMMLFEYFNMSGKQNMVSLLGARMDKGNYGKLIMYKFPQQRAIYSPYLFKNRMLQDPNISKEISLWEGKGSEVVYGDIIIVPIENSLLYLNTIYLKASTEHSMPEMKRVVMSNGDKIVIETSVDKALEKLFNYNNDSKTDNEAIDKEDKDAVIEANGSSSDIKQAAELFNKAIEAQKNGDWATYGEYINELGEVLNSLNEEE